MNKLTKICDTCQYANFDSVPYGSSSASILGICDKEDEMTDEEYKIFGSEVDCPFWKSTYNEDEEKYLQSLM